MQYKTLQFEMVYVDFTKYTMRNHISSNFSFNTGISWWFSIPGTQGCGGIRWLQSEILFCPPIMNKHWKLRGTLHLWTRIVSYFHIHLPDMFNQLIFAQHITTTLNIELRHNRRWELELARGAKPCQQASRSHHNNHCQP